MDDDKEPHVRLSAFAYRERPTIPYVFKDQPLRPFATDDLPAKTVTSGHLGDAQIEAAFKELEQLEKRSRLGHRPPLSHRGAASQTSFRTWNKTLTG